MRVSDQFPGKKGENQESIFFLLGVEINFQTLADSCLDTLTDNIGLLYVGSVLGNFLTCNFQ